MALSATPPIQDSAVTLFQASSTDVDEHCAALGRWRLSYDQISAGAFAGSFTQLSLPRVEVFREITSQQVRQYGQLGAGSFGIGLPWHGDGEVNCNGACVAGTQVITCIDAEVDMCTPKAFELRGVVTSAALIEELATRLDVELPRTVWHQLRAMEMAEAPVARLRAHLAAIQDTIATAPERFDDPAARQALEDALLVEIMDMLPTARCADPGRSAVARKRTVDRARELIHGSGDRPLSLLEICKTVGASPRKLGYCFHEVLGTSPMHYWRAMRLNRARRDLKRGIDASVYDVAVQHGFWHFSQFSLDYKRHFSELPSETLRRAQAGGLIGISGVVGAD
ncbi:helix-turn-helix domain-containing protein [Bradyrhizobium sp. GCM10027634]|uniref:helix-turn-helix domain-containing protein n=1 Tax=unclassified Bradyrhizobium TaxID=2631580 RepID=UPI00188A3C1B|nr:MULTISPECIES: helix-turn-helix domain-containing protein [unclassified Bradyrhizobium]MDN5002164.1 helix-turn-helix domain-containing protein [Bradyrhizobium sp. WYCCWR 12677]QOZ45585.1 AraC family transcriptional regulator [Bradyrhizobium sp. CCBAU 53340]